MDKGLDELIESLLKEIAYSGARGCSATNLIHAIHGFYHDGQPAADASPPVSGVATKVWGWLVTRTDVLVGADRQFNHLSLDEILSIPEAAEPVVPDKKSGKPASQDAASRPRIFVSDERQWKTLAGHGPDYKRIPQFEWRALVDIASVKDKGILQGDLVRLTGQDKRSLPTRTDALAKKGYIIKQPILLRGCRSSKLWLARFAEDARAEAKSEGLCTDSLDLSKETLTRDLEPVPFRNQWMGERLDYLALAQAYLIVLRAWGVMRYSDMRTKLGIEGAVPQMRGLAKTSRWFSNLGVTANVGAKFAANSKIFHDCIKFLRDPTQKEWQQFRTIPKTRMTAPSQRIGKRGEASRAIAKKKAGKKDKKGSKDQQDVPDEVATRDRPIVPLDQAEVTTASWLPLKPFTGITFDLIKRCGSNGLMNNEIRDLTLGDDYHKFTAAMTASMASSRTIPKHPEFQVTSQLKRIGKTMTYQFFATEGPLDLTAANQQNAPAQSDSVLDPALTGASLQPPPASVDWNFSELDMSKFSTDASLPLAQLSGSLVAGEKKARGKKQSKRQSIIPATNEAHKGRRKGRPKKQKAPIPLPEEESADQDTNTAVGRPQETPRKAEHVVSPSGDEDMPATGTNDPEQSLEDAAGLLEPRRSENIQTSLDPVDHAATARPEESEEPDAPDEPDDPPRDPGVYRGDNNSLDPVSRTKKKGRPKNSIVLIFRHDKVKEVSFLGDTSGSSSRNYRVIDGQSLASEHEVAEDTARKATEASKADTSKPLEGPRLSKRKCTNHVCEKCGQSWKNSNGLEYHQNKSRTTCNPSFIPAPPKQRPRPKSPAAPAKLDPKLSRVGRKAGPSQAKTSTPATPPSRPPKRPRPRDDDDSPSILTTPKPNNSLVLWEVEANQASSRVYGSGPDFSSPAIEKPSRKRQRLSGRPNSSKHMSEPSVNNLEGLSQMTPTEVGHGFTTGVAGNTAPPANETQFGHAYHRLDEQANVGPDEGSFPTNDQSGSHEYASIYPDLQPSQAQNWVPSAQYGPPTPPPQPSQPSQPKAKAAVGSEGKQRRDRTAEIIMDLLDKSDDVFPGELALYMVVISVWTKTYQDISPPDRKTCQTVVKRLESNFQLSTVHWLALDKNNKTWSPCVLVKLTDGRNSNIADLSKDPRAIATKEKIMAAHPEPYVPPRFALAQEASDAFTQLVSDVDKHDLGHNTTAKEVEVLQYSVPGSANNPREKPKRLALDEDSIDALTTKRPRRSAIQGADTPSDASPAQGKMQNATRAKQRSAASHWWNAGRVATYLWNQTQTTAINWDQRRAPLQDPQTGSWSVMPRIAVPSLANVENIKAVSKVPKRRYRKRAPDNEMIDPRLIEEDAAFTDYEARPVSSSSSEAPELIPGGHHAKPNTFDPFTKPETIESIARTVGSRSCDADEATPVERHARQPALPDAFTDLHVISCHENWRWPSAEEAFGGVRAFNYTMRGPMPTSEWLSRENLPQDIDEILAWCRKHVRPQSWTDGYLGEFHRRVDATRSWELSEDGARILGNSGDVLGRIFIDFTLDEELMDWRPVSVDWSGAEHSSLESPPRDLTEYRSGVAADRSSAGTSTRFPIFTQPGSEPELLSKDYNARIRKNRGHDKEVRLPAPPGGYKKRMMAPIPEGRKGRTNKRRPSVAKRGLTGETDLIAAFVVIKTLVGGVAGATDYGLLLKVFTEQSLSFLRKFWPRVCKERKRFVEALTDKFQEAFLDAYEKGEWPPIDYDNLEDYDWVSLIAWAAKLDLPNDMELPPTRRQLEQTHILTNPEDESIDWRDTWFSRTSVAARVEANVATSLTTSIDGGQTPDKDLVRARTWVRALCCTSLKGAGAPERARDKLLQLTDGDAAADRLLSVVCRQLALDRVSVRTKSKSFGQQIRLHAQFLKHLNKQANADKFAQATELKAQLDECFRRTGVFNLPDTAGDGATLALINLQSGGRIRLEAAELPNIPYGFQPGNYEGRTYPKSYYKFDIHVFPTESYIYNDDLAVLDEARNLDVPVSGPHGEMPLWVDLFGTVDKARWIEYVCMMAFAMATKGPLTLESATTVLRPLLEPCEAQMIFDYLDKLGLLQQAGVGSAVTVAEWWWLALGQMVDPVSQDDEMGVVSGAE